MLTLCLLWKGAFGGGAKKEEGFEVDHCVTMYVPAAAPCSRVAPRSSSGSALARVLRGKRVGFVGDSLTRQWFETLSCAMNLTTTWYAAESETAVAAAEAGVIPMHAAPKGIPKKNVSGCATSTSSDVRLSYYHLDKYDARTVPFVAGRNDVVVANVGVHYDGFAELDAYQSDLYSLFRDLRHCNAGERRCLFRETLPQHFATGNPREAQLGLYDHKHPPKHGCGPIQNATKTPYNALSANISQVWNVPAISVDFLTPLWHYHRPPADCTHYCQEPVVWDNLHDALVQALSSWKWTTTTPLEEENILDRRRGHI